MRLLCVAVVAAGLLGCGPIEYLHTVALNANRAVAHAKAAGGEKLAPYEYWSAVEYLQMARDTGSYADYQLSNRYGEKAEKMASEASAIAAKKREAGPPTVGGEEVPPDLSKSGEGRREAPKGKPAQPSGAKP
jgi:hypothetical protein